MGFRCSLLGHDYGDSEVDRDREERGDEVVVTVHEFRTCARCGRTKTVSENKEVTSIAADENVVDGTESGDGVLIDDETDASGSTPADAAGTGTPAAETAAGTDEPTGTDEPSRIGPERPAADDEAPTVDEEVATDPARDDGVILDDESGDDDDREYGEWPEHDRPADAPEESNPSEWPGAGDAEDGSSAVPPDETTDPDVDFDDGELVPGATAYPDEDAQVIDDEPAGGTAAGQVANERGSTGITSAGSVPSPDAGSPNRATEPLVCPECEMSARARNSLRQGDICPECKRGYLTERERNR